LGEPFVGKGLHATCVPHALGHRVRAEAPSCQ
jgi:hypothetical protein